MKTKYTFALVTPLSLAVAVLLGACSSVPRTTSLLEQTRNDYQMAQNSPVVVSYAPLELKQAGEALALATAASNDRDSAEKIDRLSYLAKQKVAVAQEAGKQKSAEAEVAKTSKERDQIRLDQRTNEADQAKANAEQAKLSAQLAKSDAADAQRQAQGARLKTQEAERQTQQAQARNAQLEAQLADLAAKKTDRGMIITLGDVLFGTDLARLNAEGLRTAQKLADVLQQNPQRNVLIEGFTDSTGTSPHNQELSERRATSVLNALAGMGIARERIAVRGYGEAYPVAANDTAQNRQLNRRVEIVLPDDSGKTSQR